MSFPNLVVGLTIMAVGVLLILDRLGYANAMDLLKYWPIVLVLFGGSVAVQSLRPRDPSAPAPKPAISPGFVLFVLIVAMFATSGFRSWDWNTTSAAANAERINLFGVMGSARRTSTSDNFQGAHLGSLMGRSTLDLREARIAPGEAAYVDVFVAMGRATIRVPEGWTVDTSALPVMGAVEDNRWPALDREREPSDDAQADGAAPPPGAAPVEAVDPAKTGPSPRLVLRGFVLMGKVEIQS